MTALTPFPSLPVPISFFGTAVFQNGAPPTALFVLSHRFRPWSVLISSCITRPLVMERFVFFMERFSVGHGTYYRLTASFRELTAEFPQSTASSMLSSLRIIEKHKNRPAFYGRSGEWRRDLTHCPRPNGRVLFRTNPYGAHSHVSASPSNFFAHLGRPR